MAQRFLWAEEKLENVWIFKGGGDTLNVFENARSFKCWIYFKVFFFTFFQTDVTLMAVEKCYKYIYIVAQKDKRHKRLAQ